METYPDSVTQVFNLPRAAAAAAGLMLRIKIFCVVVGWSRRRWQQHCVLFLWLTSFWNNESESEPCCLIVKVKTCLQLYCGCLPAPLKTRVNAASVWNFSPFLFLFLLPCLFCLYWFSTRNSTTEKNQTNGKTKVYNKKFAVSLKNVNLWCPLVLLVTFEISPSVAWLVRECGFLFTILLDLYPMSDDACLFPRWSSRLNRPPPNSVKERGRAASARAAHTPEYLDRKPFRAKRQCSWRHFVLKCTLLNL